MISTLKDAIHAILENSPIPTRQLAEELGVSYGYLMNFGNSEQPDFKMQARLLIPLTRITGDFSAVDFIEHSLGRTALKLPPENKNLSIKEVQTELLDAVGVFGELVSNATAALSDNKITNTEAADLERRGYRLISEILEFLQAIETCRSERGGYVRRR